MSRSKTLMIFDFDHTIVDGNTSVEMQKIRRVPLTNEITELFKTRQNYMGVIYKLLHESGVSADEMKERVLAISLIYGMKELFDYLDSDLYEVIIVSDANTLFIDWLLTKHGIRQQVHCIYSNPAELNEEGRVVMKHYHLQNWCNLSSPNMCKGDILEKHVKKREAQGVSFTRLCYVGDGGNDYCPTLRLSDKDLAFVRANYDLETMVEENKSKLKAKVVLWNSGLAILDILKSLETQGLVN